MQGEPEDHSTPQAGKTPVLSRITRGQLLMMLGLSSVLVVILSAAIAYLLLSRPRVASDRLPSGSAGEPVPALSEADIQAIGTPEVRGTPIPTYAYRSTLTPLPSPTFFVLKMPTQAKPANAAPQYDPGSSGGYDCTPALDEAHFAHEDRIKEIEAYYAPYFAEYQALVDQASAQLDAYLLARAQQALKQLNLDYETIVSEENQRYKRQVQGIEAGCQ